MTDIAPDLLEEIEKVFTIKRERDKILGPIYWKIQEGKGTYRDVAEYADRLGEILAEAMKLRISTDNLPDGRMYYNIAERVIGPLLKEDHELIADAAVAAQESLNRAAGLHLKAVRPKLNEDRLEGIIDKISTADNFDDVSWLLDEPVINFSRAVVDDTIRENVDFHARAGLQPKIKRIAESGCCEWCSQLAGEYNYPVNREVYQRHERCRCLVLYDPGDGKVQDAHTKVVYDSQAKAERDARAERAKQLERQRNITEQRRREIRKVSNLEVGGTKISGIRDHAFDRMDERGISIEGIKDAIEHPLQINPVKIDSEGRRSFVVVGEHATIAINPDTGEITTTHATHSKTVEKLRKGK